MLININTDIKNDYCFNSHASGKCCTVPLKTTTLIQRSSYQFAVLSNISKISSVEHTMESILNFDQFFTIARTMTDCCLFFCILKDSRWTYMSETYFNSQQQNQFYSASRWNPVFAKHKTRFVRIQVFPLNKLEFPHPVEI